MALFAAGVALAARRAEEQGAPAPIPERDLRRAARTLPCLGLGCFPLGNLGSEDAGVAVVQRALELGVRYFDTAPSYNDGTSERRVGLGLKGFAREKLWIATKTQARDGDGALAELERSLERLGTDYVDSVQVHALGSEQDVEAIFRKGAVVDALESAREKKKLRHVGVTGHRDPRWLLAAIERHEFATALVPVNPLDCLHRSFTRDFVPRAQEKGVAVVAMKVYAGGALLRSDSKTTAGELVRFALAQPGVCVAVPGADSVAHLDEARAALALPLPDEAAQKALVERLGPHRGRESEWYKDE